MMNEIYLYNDFLHQRHNLDLNICAFCISDNKTIEHLFFTCRLTRTFWDAFQGWITYNDQSIPNIQKDKVWSPTGGQENRIWEL